MKFNIKFLFMKFLGFLTVILGFSYSVTSLYNFFDVVINKSTVYETSNLIFAIIGIIFPLFIFIFGIFFYFYADNFDEKRRLWIFICTLLILLIGVLDLVCNLVTIDICIFHVFDFLHITFMFVTLTMSIAYIYGMLKYKF